MSPCPAVEKPVRVRCGIGLGRQLVLNGDRGIAHCIDRLTLRVQAARSRCDGDRPIVGVEVETVEGRSSQIPTQSDVHVLDGKDWIDRQIERVVPRSPENAKEEGLLSQRLIQRDRVGRLVQLELRIAIARKGRRLVDGSWWQRSRSRRSPAAMSPRRLACWDWAGWPGHV